MSDLGITIANPNILIKTWQRLISLLKAVVGFSFMAVTFTLHFMLLLLILPSRLLRLRATSRFGNFAGRGMVTISGCKLKIINKEQLKKKTPGIYISNHTSVLDLFLAMSRTPPGTSGVAKKEILRIPFFGQVYALSGHLVIDRSNTDKAKNSMREMSEYMEENGLSAFIWPEGTRSRDGRLKAFKKGFAHMAVQTGLPIIPFVVSGAHHCWKPGSLMVKPVPVTMEVLPPIDTSDWTLENMDEKIMEVWELFRERLPRDQKPLPAA